MLLTLRSLVFSIINTYGIQINHRKLAFSPKYTFTLKSLVPSIISIYGIQSSDCKLDGQVYL